jgi:hypothetical protein
MTQFRKYLMASPMTLALALTACGGGGGGGGVASTPPPPPPPPAMTSPPIVPVSTSQEFATKGASYTTPSASYDEFTVSSPSLADNAQLDVRYNAASKGYEIQLPGGTAWQSIPLASDYPDDPSLFLYRGGAPDYVGVFDHRSNLQYSALLEWWTDNISGFSAIGVATLPGNVPVTGSASYSGSIVGASSELRLDPWEAIWNPALVTGSINLSFDFGGGTLSGKISPVVHLDGPDFETTLNFTNTVYSSGSTTFTGAFATGLAGQNSFSGRFTGPNAQELIGNFAFPYASPVDGTIEQAAGAFAGRKP